MNLELFIKTNDLKEFEFERIEYKDSNIYIYTKMNIEIEYMANGCRPEFDNMVRHLYVFKSQDKCKSFNRIQYVNDYKYDGKELVIDLTDGELVIKNCEIEVIQNIM